MAGARFLHLPETLYDYHVHDSNFSRQARENDGYAKAHIVRNNPAFFHRRVREWADGLLRNRLHSQAFRRGHIPAPKDVRALLSTVESKVLRMSGV